MNFSASEIQEDLLAIKDKLDDGITIDDVLNVINLPILSDFSQSAEGLLPVNLLKIESNGKVNLLSLTELQKALSKGLGDIKGYLEGEVLDLFNTIKGEVKAVYNEAKEIYNELSNIENTFQLDNSKIFDLALSTLNGATGLNISAQNLANLKNVSQNTLKNFSNLSPKQIKDLGNPDYFGKIVSTTLDATIAATGVAAEIMGEQSIQNPQLDTSSYMNLFKDSSDKQVKLAVERKTYWAKGEGATPETAAMSSSSNKFKLINDYSIAVDNTNIFLGDKIRFIDDNKEREAVDIATRSKGINVSGTYPVVAIFFENREDALEYEKKYSKFTTAIINRI